MSLNYSPSRFLAHVIGVLKCNLNHVLLCTRKQGISFSLILVFWNVGKFIFQNLKQPDVFVFLLVLEINTLHMVRQGHKLSTVYFQYIDISTQRQTLLCSKLIPKAMPAKPTNFAHEWLDWSTSSQKLNEKNWLCINIVNIADVIV